jgi:hypothetical protein
MARHTSPVGIVDTSTRLRAFESVPIGLVVWCLEDPTDVRSFRLMDFNQAAERELGASIGDRAGKTIGVVAPMLLKNGVAELLRRVALSGKRETIGELSYGDEGIPESIFWVECFPLPANCVGVAIENVTERRKAEQAAARDLQLLHHITVALNASTDPLDAAQFCLAEVCRQINWPVGRLFLVDEECTTKFLPNSVWHFSDEVRFQGFREVTEMYERDLENKFVLEYRVRQGRRAGLTRSVGFSVVEGDWLRAVLEFSSESTTPLDNSSMSLIADIGVQLGRVFERERAARAFASLNERLLRQEQERREANRKLHLCTGKYLPPLRASLATLRARKRGGSGTGARELANSVRLVQRYLAEMSAISSPPVEFRQKA